MRFSSLSVLALAAALFTPVASAQLEAVVQVTGKISLSSDGNGNNSPGGGLLQVDKPAGATVRGAYLCAASSFNRVINNGDITLTGTPLTWDDSVFNGFPGNETFFNNVFDDVTSLVKPIVDAAPAGLVNIAVNEVVDTSTIDGTVLTVIFDDPSVLDDHTAILLFGGQLTAGDTFAINLAAPLQPGGVATMGLGISFSFQGPTGTAMISEIDVNGARLTSSAGGEDDGEGANGGLLTAGGIGDSLTNPAPFAPATSLFTDDELYDLLPFVNSGDMQIVVATLNPSADDNIFCGYFVTSVPSALNESVLLAPLTATKTVGESHTVTATVVDDDSNPIAGRLVNFNVLSGPNAGDNGSDLTDADGKASFTYVGDGGAGTDTLVADMLDSANELKVSNQVTATWNSLVELIDNGCAGSHGTPMLTVSGDFLPNTDTQALLVGALHDAPAVLMIGLHEASLVRNGCSLLFQPELLVTFTTDAIGSVATSGRWPAGVPAGQQVFFQFYVDDAGAPAGFATSNTVVVTTP